MNATVPADSVSLFSPIVRTASLALGYNFNSSEITGPLRNAVTSLGAGLPPCTGPSAPRP